MTYQWFYHGIYEKRYQGITASPIRNLFPKGFANYIFSNSVLFV